MPAPFELLNGPVTLYKGRSTDRRAGDIGRAARGMVACRPNWR